MEAVTVIICNHNYGQWVADAIESAISQNYENKQIVVIDDGSTDNSLEVVSQLIGISKPSQDAELHLGNACGVKIGLIPLAKAGGPSAARNIGIKLTWAETDIYAILDADDMYLQGKIERSVAKLSESKNIAACYSDYDTLNVLTGVYRREYKPPFSLELLQRECHIHSACHIKKEALASAGLYDESFRVAEDYELWLRISKQYGFAHIPESLMIVRTGNYNSSSTVDKTVWEDAWRRIAAKHLCK